MRKISTTIFLMFLLFGSGLPARAQKEGNVRLFSLKEVIEIAREQSPSFRYATVSLENRQWQYKTYRSNFLPQLTLNGTLPDYNKVILPVQQPDGSFDFKQLSSATSALSLSLGQEVWFSGGYISINTSMQRIDDLRETNRAPVKYASVPATITLNQPFFNFNYRAWDRKIQPLRLEEAKKEYWEELEDISITATDHFFNLLISQISNQIAQKNVANNDTLYKLSLVKFKEKKIPENELLQIELTLMNARQNLEQAALDVEGGTLRLKVFLGLVDDDPIVLIPPFDIPEFKVDETFALQQARKNRPRMIAFQREILEAERQMAQAKGETGFHASLFASFGLTQQSEDIWQVYNDPTRQQRLRIGFNVPVMDWGRTDARLGTAKASSELVKSNIEQQKINFDQDIYLNVKRFKVLRTQMAVARRTDEVAERRYVITKERYFNGQITILDLNVATEERDKATRSYISALRSFWWAYFQLRRLTLYDFENDQPLIPQEVSALKK